MPLKSLLPWLLVGLLAAICMVAIWPSPLDSYPKPPRLSPDHDRSATLKREYDAWSEKAGQEKLRALVVFLLANVAGSCAGQVVRLSVGWELRSSFALATAGAMLFGIICDNVLPISYLATIPNEFVWGILLDLWPFSTLIALGGFFNFAAILSLLLILAAMLLEKVMGQPL